MKEFVEGMRGPKYKKSQLVLEKEGVKGLIDSMKKDTSGAVAPPSPDPSDPMALSPATHLTATASPDVGVDSPAPTTLSPVTTPDALAPALAPALALAPAPAPAHEASPMP